MGSHIYSCLLLTSSQVSLVTNSLDEVADLSLINHPMWFWLFLVQCMIILLLTHLLVQKKINAELAEFEKERVRGYGKTKVDMDNVVNSINEAEKLYKELSRKCHPDRFIGDARQEQAELLFQEISSNKRDYNSLIFLKKEAIKKLDIQFKN
jgi:hypothetical protein